MHNFQMFKCKFLLFLLLMLVRTCGDNLSVYSCKLFPFFFSQFTSNAHKAVKRQNKQLAPKHCFNIKRKALFIYLTKAFFEIRSSL